MRDTLFLVWAGSSRPERSDLFLFARLTEVGNSACHQLAAPADLTTDTS